MVKERFEKNTIIAFKKSIIIGEKVYALDWMHNGYLFDPTLNFETDEFGDWLIPIIPNGDHFFLQRDFKWGIIGHLGKKQ
ncbi:DUF2716 domain-containing protein [Niallia sp. HCP3S3_B10]|uniref:DUF2716 domain-containing protein n=1 Tax=Niallia sp. HCP3S3_B10 TaxID=3438944 RepID=UPI003F8CD39D